MSFCDCTGDEGGESDFADALSEIQPPGAILLINAGASTLRIIDGVNLRFFLCLLSLFWEALSDCAFADVPIPRDLTTLLSFVPPAGLIGVLKSLDDDDSSFGVAG